MIKGKGEWLNLVNLEETSRLSQSQFSEFSKMFQGPAETILNIDQEVGLSCSDLLRNQENIRKQRIITTSLCWEILHQVA